MIKGIFLGISLSLFLTSLIIMTAGISGNIQENYVTGAVIGADSVTSYATITGIISLLLCIFCLFMILRNKKH